MDQKNRQSLLEMAYAFSCLMIRFAYFGLFSVTQASRPEESKIVILALEESIA